MRYWHHPILKTTLLCFSIALIFKECLVRRISDSLPVFEVGVLSDRINTISNRYCDSSGEVNAVTIEGELWIKKIKYKLKIQ